MEMKLSVFTRDAQQDRGPRSRVTRCPGPGQGFKRESWPCWAGCSCHKTAWGRRSSPVTANPDGLLDTTLQTVVPARWHSRWDLLCGSGLATPACPPYALSVSSSPCLW